MALAVPVPGHVLGLDDEWLPSPVFTPAERDALRVFATVRDAAEKALGDDYPPLEAVQRDPRWSRLAEAAASALVTFESRGKLSEEVEGSDP